MRYALAACYRRINAGNVSADTGSDSTTSISCGFVAQHAVQQAVQRIHNKSKLMESDTYSAQYTQLLEAISDFHVRHCTIGPSQRCQTSGPTFTVSHAHTTFMAGTDCDTYSCQIRYRKWKKNLGFLRILLITRFNAVLRILQALETHLTATRTCVRVGLLYACKIFICQKA